MRNVHNKLKAFAVPLALLSIAFVVAVTAWGTYMWQHSKVDNLNAKVDTLNAQIVKQNDQIVALSHKLAQACQSAPQTNANCTNYSYISKKGVTVLVYVPLKDAVVTSPVTVIGEIPGNWSFEAQFPLQLKDSSGNVVAQSSAHLLGDWQTSQLVPFSAQLTVTKAVSGSGELVLQKDNPSDLPSNTDSIAIPVRF